MPQLESASQAELKSLCDSELSGVVHSYSFIQGVIFAVAAAPEIPMPETWLPMTIKTSNQLTSVEQADNLTDLLMKSLQLQLKDMSDEKIDLPNDIGFDPGSDKQGPLSQWCEGLLFAHSQLEPVWQDAWSKMQITDPTEMRQLQKDLAHCLNMYSTFADVQLAISQAKSRGNNDLSDMLPRVFLSFSQSLKTYVGLSGRLVDFLPNQFETFEQKH